MVEIVSIVDRERLAVLQKGRERQMARLSAADEIAARSGMVQIVRYRFRAFQVKFQREPAPNEPLFFDESKEAPVLVEPRVALMQLKEAALASGTELGPVLKFLGLAPTTGRGRGATGGISRRAKSQRPLTRRNRSSRVSLRQSTVWNTFLADRRLRHRYAISNEELEMLSQASFLGRPRTIEDCLVILKLIREASSES
jgi:hypothetical protein